VEQGDNRKGEVVEDGGGYGGGKANASLSTTKTQSPEAGGVKVCVPVVANVPIVVVTPVAGWYQ
jgi:hypothetical protein